MIAIAIVVLAFGILTFLTAVSLQSLGFEWAWMLVVGSIVLMIVGFAMFGIEFEKLVSKKEQEQEDRKKTMEDEKRRIFGE